MQKHNLKLLTLAIISYRIIMIRFGIILLTCLLSQTAFAENFTTSYNYIYDQLSYDDEIIPSPTNISENPKLTTNESPIKNFYLPAIQAPATSINPDSFSENYNYDQTQDVIASGQVYKKWHFMLTGFRRNPDTLNYNNSDTSNNPIGSGQIHFGLTYRYD